MCLKKKIWFHKPSRKSIFNSFKLIISAPDVWYSVNAHRFSITVWWGKGAWIKLEEVLEYNFLGQKACWSNVHISHTYYQFSTAVSGSPACTGFWRSLAPGLSSDNMGSCEKRRKRETTNTTQLSHSCFKERNAEHFWCKLFGVTLTFYLLLELQPFV